MVQAARTPGSYRPPTPLRSGARSAVCRTLPGHPTHGRLNLRKVRIMTYFSKVSQNDEVSLKMSEKAYVSPCFQNGLRNSPLEILGFPFSPAFSAKELMVPF